MEKKQQQKYHSVETVLKYNGKS